MQAILRLRRNASLKRGESVHRAGMSPNILSSGWFIFFWGKGKVAHWRTDLVIRDHPFSLRTLRGFRYKMFSDLPARRTLIFHGRATHYAKTEIKKQVWNLVERESERGYYI